MKETELFEAITELDSNLIVEVVSIRDRKTIRVNSAVKMDKKLLSQVLNLVNERKANLVINNYGSLEITF